MLIKAYFNPSIIGKNNRNNLQLLMIHYQEIKFKNEG